MKYFLDTEFISGFKSSYWKLPLQWKPRHFIDLISIGIVCEDGREYYAISNEFVGDDADEWVRENVIYPIIEANGYSKNLSNLHHVLTYDSHALSRIQKQIGKSNKQIAEEICMFCYPQQSWQFKDAQSEFLSRAKEYGWIADQPEFYGYYADYDWVLFCSLFGRMIDLPKGFPMYCRDLKQMLDERVYQELYAYNHEMVERYNTTVTAELKREWTFENELSRFKNKENYPKQENEHNALADAKWNYELYKFLATS